MRRNFKDYTTAVSLSFSGFLPKNCFLLPKWCDYHKKDWRREKSFHNDDLLTWNFVVGEVCGRNLRWIERFPSDLMGSGIKIESFVMFPNFSDKKYGNFIGKLNKTFPFLAAYCVKDTSGVFKWIQTASPGWVFQVWGSETLFCLHFPSLIQF